MPSFQLPAGMTSEATRALERACMAGGHDNMPWASQVRLSAGQMHVRHNVEDSGSGYLLAPWSLPGIGLLMGASPTLRERLEPYHLLLELARGKVNQVRCQANDWQAIGIPAAGCSPGAHPGADAPIRPGRHLDTQHQRYAEAQAAGGSAGTPWPRRCWCKRTRSPTSWCAAAATLFSASGRKSCRAWIRCWVAGSGVSIPPPEQGELLRQSFNSVTIPISWNHVEAEEARYNWKACDALVDWAIGQKLHVAAGPLIDFSSALLPAWLWLWENDLASMATFMCRFVESAVRRYGSRIRRWQLTAASNWATVLGLGEEELLGLTDKLVETVRKVDPALDLSIGIAQPWGDYMAASDRTHSPYIFADTLIRYGVHLQRRGPGVDPGGFAARQLLPRSARSVANSRLLRLAGSATAGDAGLPIRE